MLLEVVLTLEGLSAGLAGEGDVVLVGALVDHEVVGLGEAPLAILAHELALGAHLATKLSPLIRLYWHDGEHCRCLCVSLTGRSARASATNAGAITRRREAKKGGGGRDQVTYANVTRIRHSVKVIPDLLRSTPQRLFSRRDSTHGFPAAENGLETSQPPSSNNIRQSR